MQSGVWALMFWRNVITVVIRVDMEVLVAVTSCRLKMETVSLSQTFGTQLPEFMM